MIMKNVKQQQKLGFHQNFTSSILVFFCIKLSLKSWIP